MKPKDRNNKNLQHRSACPIASTLDLIGDKWSLLIIRDMQVFRKTKYDEFLTSPEKISTNILANRLKKLEENEFITKTPYGAHSQRMSYQLTTRGKSLAKLIKEFGKWGIENIPGTSKNIGQ